MYNPEIEETLGTVEAIQATLEAVRKDGSLTAADRKNIVRRLTRKMEKLQTGATVNKFRGKTPALAPEERLAGVIETLRYQLTEVNDEILINHTGVGYLPGNVLEAMDTLKLDYAGIAGVLVENYRKKWAEAPQWFTVSDTDAGKVLVLGPVPFGTGF